MLTQTLATENAKKHQIINFIKEAALQVSAGQRIYIAEIIPEGMNFKGNAKKCYQKHNPESSWLPMNFRDSLGNWHKLYVYHIHSRAELIATTSLELVEQKDRIHFTPVELETATGGANATPSQAWINREAWKRAREMNNGQRKGSKQFFGAAMREIWAEIKADQN